MNEWQELLDDPEADALIQPQPRNPPERSFESLSKGRMRLDASFYIDLLRKPLRYGSQDYSLDPPTPPPPWTDEEGFYTWLSEQKLPRELAEMLYAGAPEISFFAGSGYINGVSAIIEENSDPDRQNIRKAGFLILGSGSNGDELVVDVAYQGSGEVGFMPLETMWDKSPSELQAIFIPFCPSIGEYLRLHEEREAAALPGDYWSAKEKRDQGLL